MYELEGFFMVRSGKLSNVGPDEPKVRSPRRKNEIFFSIYVFLCQEHDPDARNAKKYVKNAQKINF